MSATNPKSGACNCGQVVFDLTERKSGEILHCSWCGKKYRFLGGDRIAPLSAEESRLAAGGAKSIRPRAAKRPDGPPGGVLPMIGFIVAVNALAFLTLWLTFPKEEVDGLRHAFWDHDLTIPGTALWPDLLALLLGHALGFAGWAWFVYHAHKREKLEKQA